MKTCYLSVTIRKNPLSPFEPQVSGVDLLSETPSGATTRLGEVRCEVYKIERSTYQEARDLMLKTVKENLCFSWLWPWLDPSKEAHEKRYGLFEKIEKARKAEILEVQLREEHMKDCIAGKFEVPAREV